MVRREFAVASIGAGSEMSEEYRATLLRLMANQAYGELRAATIYAKWVRRAPGPEERLLIGEIVHEEVEHWYAVVKLMVELGVPAENIAKHQSRQMFYPLARIVVPRFTWLDVLMSTFLIDRAAYFMLEDYAQSSYEPWARVTNDTLEEEDDHSMFGQEFLAGQIQKYGTARIQKALNRWWRIALNSFGPPLSKHHETYLRFGLKYRSNEDRRRVFRTEIEERISALELEVPRLFRDRYPFL